jgi:predicted Ser/Thr protein kinase
MRLVGSYRLVSELGAGGAGTVYLAADSEGREVALKLLPPRTGSDTQLRRFHREVDALTRVDHPHVVRFLDSGKCGDGFYIVMERVAGSSLDELIYNRGRILQADAVEIAISLARALESVHAEGILHRDLKPANVLIEPNGKAKLTDFGLARDLDGASHLTQTGMFTGSPGYLAPEQARGDLDLIGVATDVYGLGGTLYAMLTGEPPTPSESFVEALQSAVSTVPTRPSRLLKRAMPVLDAICMRCLEKAPADRYPSALAVAEALEAYAAGDWTPPRSAAMKIGALTFGTILLAVGGYAFGADPHTLATDSPARTPSPGRGTAPGQAPPILGRSLPRPRPAEADLEGAHQALLQHRLDLLDRRLEEVPTPARGAEWWILRGSYLRNEHFYSGREEDSRKAEAAFRRAVDAGAACEGSLARVIYVRDRNDPRVAGLLAQAPPADPDVLVVRARQQAAKAYRLPRTDPARKESLAKLAGDFGRIAGSSPDPVLIQVHRLHLIREGAELRRLIEAQPHVLAWRQLYGYHLKSVAENAKPQEPALFRDAIAVFDDCLRLRPHYPKINQERGWTRFQLARLTRDGALLAQAEADLRETLRLAPETKRTRVVLGIILEGRGAYRLAAESYEDEIANGPSQFDVYTRAISARLQARDFERAKQVLEQAERLFGARQPALEQIRASLPR